MKVKPLKVIIAALMFLVVGCESVPELGNKGKESSAPPPLLKSAAQAKFVPYDHPPRPIEAIRPEYPPQAKTDALEGTVIIQVEILASGEVGETVVLKGVRDDLDQAALNAISKVRFDPATKDDKEIDVWISIPIQFKLNEDE